MRALEYLGKRDVRDQRDLKGKTVLFYDHGLFTHFALTLSRYFGRVLYYSPYQSAFPTSSMVAPGSGYDGRNGLDGRMERTNKPWSVMDEVDLVVFADIYDGDLQAWMRKKGKLVWGCGAGEVFEEQRWEQKEIIRKAGLPVQPVRRVVGVKALRDYLKAHEDKFVKLSFTRGDMETWHHENYVLSTPKLAKLEAQLGPMGASKEFVIEDPVSDAVEAGYDGYCIGGKFPKMGLLGYEIKDCGLMGAVRKYADFPESVRMVNEKLAPQLAEWDYRGMISTEVRVTKDGKGYLIDPTCRMAAPPSEMYEELYSNWGEILWQGAQGVCVDPVPVAKFGVEALIHSEWAEENWQPVHIPNGVRRWVKLRNGCRVDGVDYVAPQDYALKEIGAVVGIGDTIEEAVAMCRRVADQVKGEGVKIRLDAIGDALREIAEGEEMGVEFSDEELPTEEEVKAES